MQSKKQHYVTVSNYSLKAEEMAIVLTLHQLSDSRRCSINKWWTQWPSS